MRKRLREEEGPQAGDDNLQETVLIDPTIDAKEEKGVATSSDAMDIVPEDEIRQPEQPGIGDGGHLGEAGKASKSPRLSLEQTTPYPVLQASKASGPKDADSM